MKPESPRKLELRAILGRHLFDLTPTIIASMKKLPDVHDVKCRNLKSNRHFTVTYKDGEKIKVNILTHGAS